MNQRNTFLTASLFGALSVSIGAFGAHGLKSILAETGRSETFELAVRYQFYHTFALLISGLLMEKFSARALHAAPVFFTLGIALFSGSLFILSLTGTTWLGAVTPLGGLCFILGWGSLFAGVYKKKIGPI